MDGGTAQLEEQSRGTKATDISRPWGLKYMWRHRRGEPQSDDEPDHTGLSRQQLQIDPGYEQFLGSVYLSSSAFLSHSCFPGREHWEVIKSVPSLLHVFHFFFLHVVFPLAQKETSLRQPKARNISPRHKFVSLFYFLRVGMNPGPHAHYH
jgi:hypothetical protein